MAPGRPALRDGRQARPRSGDATRGNDAAPPRTVLAPTERAPSRRHAWRRALRGRTRSDARWRRSPRGPSGAQRSRPWLSPSKPRATTKPPNRPAEHQTQRGVLPHRGKTPHNEQTGQPVRDVVYRIVERPVGPGATSTLPPRRRAIAADIDSDWSSSGTRLSPLVGGSKLS